VSLCETLRQPGSCPLCATALRDVCALRLNASTDWTAAQDASQQPASCFADRRILERPGERAGQAVDYRGTTFKESRTLFTPSVALAVATARVLASADLTVPLSVTTLLTTSISMSLSSRIVPQSARYWA
jgi:hypothetical protein